MINRSTLKRSGRAMPLNNCPYCNCDCKGTKRDIMVKLSNGTKCNMYVCNDCKTHDLDKLTDHLISGWEADLQRQSSKNRDKYWDSYREIKVTEIING